MQSAAASLAQLGRSKQCPYKKITLFITFVIYNSTIKLCRFIIL